MLKLSYIKFVHVQTLFLLWSTNSVLNGNQMDEQVKEMVEVRKAVKTLPVPYSRKARKNLIVQQGQYQQKYGKKISAKALAGKLLETATL